MECPNCHKSTDPHSPRCWACGATIPPGQFLLEESGVIATPEPDVATVEIPASPSPVATSCPVATLGDRCVAVVLDAIVLLAAFAVVDTWTFLRWRVPAGSEWKITGALLLISATLNFVIFFAYVWLLEAAFGATLGKAIVGIRVLGNDHRGALAASAIRNLFRIVDGMGFYLVGLVVASCTRLRQRLGDLCAGTVVVAPELSAWIKPLAFALWVTILAGASWAVPHICSRNHAVHRLPIFGRVVARLGRTDNSVYIRVARFKIEVQQNDGQVPPPAPAQNAASTPTPVPLSGGD